MRLFFLFSGMRKGGCHTYYIYIITNRNRTVLYTGVTNSISRRLFEHDKNIRYNIISFASKNKCRHLVYYEKFKWILNAIAREKEIKGWRREKKMELIKSLNPN